ncbi:hypothetical protein WSM22_06280 [Cytophagales bacterium WSM2-2]|nr:hypothetical protein WSM22_06280 [Cytophagales bacterium WSM2-2]
MGISFEQGSLNNIASFRGLISICINLGSSYNPPKAILRIERLNSLLTETDAALKKWNDLRKEFIQSEYDCGNIFRDVIALGREVLRVFESSHAPRQVTTVVSGHYNMLFFRGKKRRFGRLDEKTDREMLEAHHGREKVIEAFDNFIAFIENEPSYHPNDPSLEVSALRAFRVRLCAADDTVLTSSMKERNARLIRNKYMCEKDRGLVDVALAVKEYFSTSIPVASEQYREHFKFNITKFTTIRF